ncbi:hypothetical protein Poli38472_004782 [Pythium oligandrum]|uniref:Chitin-binding type-4 domain-containing protein n=1 Tax=Pythium oligandrum TaxID=41045 RepID=A0A8K1FIG1_PYTOL|nr:hypothetical protein Poli38472_004782 [Pythium oligandrum]|eukprot:TMW59713.1 hypothetical protein Poli38472_004782 [Pythium oligandrum]
MFSAKQVTTAVFAIAALAHTVHGHGQMTKPAPREVTARYTAECYFGLRGAGNDELQWAPVENLIQRKQADQPSTATFDIMNGCRGMIYEEGQPVTNVTPGQEVTVEYYIQAPHPGYMELGIVRPSSDANGLITYTRDETIGVLKRVDNFAENSNTAPIKVTIPADIKGCGKAGDCALQFYWHSDIAKQTYPTCADIVVTGSGSGGNSGTAPSPAPSKNNNSTSPSTAPSSAPSTAPTSVPSTAPTTAPSATPAPTKKTCTRRSRARRN